MRIGGPVVAVAAVLVLGGCTGVDADGDLVANTSRLTVVPQTVPPDPGPGQPAPRDPAPPDPAPPDPAPPDPAPARPASPVPGVVEQAEREEAAQEAAAAVPSPVDLACADVVEALTDAVVRYETVALAESGSGGDRGAAAADMRADWDRARTAAERMGGGLVAAAAPALAAVTALHDGLATRPTLDQSDAGPWREAREALQAWCAAQS